MVKESIYDKLPIETFTTGQERQTENRQIDAFQMCCKSGENEWLGRITNNYMEWMGLNNLEID